MRWIILAALAATLAGCETAPGPAPSGPQAAGPASSFPEPTPTRATKAIVTYKCDDGETFVASFLVSPAVVDLRFASGSTVRLMQERSGSGFVYRNPFHTLQGKGDEATYTFGRQAPKTCRAGPR